MPPKKKGGKKKGGKKAPVETGESLSADGPPIRGPDDVVMRLKERALMDRVATLEAQNKKLLATNRDLKDGIEDTNTEQADVYVYLHKKLDENFDVIASLEDKLEELEAENERLRADAEADAEKLRDESSVREAELRKEITRLQDELTGLEEFSRQREGAQAEIRRLQETLELERQARLEEVADLERRNVAAKEKLKREMFAKIKETKRSILQATGDQLHHTTKRTMAENEQITTELTYQSKETERVIEMNKRLIRQNGDLKRQCELLEQAQGELVKRTHFFQKLVKKLNEKLQMSEEREKVMRDAEFGSRSLGSRTTVDRAQAISALHAELSEAMRRASEADEAAEEARMRADAAERQLDQYRELADDTTKFLMSSIEEIRNQRASGISESTSLHSLRGAEKVKAVDQLLSRMQLYESTMAANPYKDASRASSPAGSFSFFPPLGPPSTAGSVGIGAFPPGSAGSAVRPSSRPQGSRLSSRGGVGRPLSQPQRASSPAVEENRTPTRPIGPGGFPYDGHDNGLRQALHPTTKPLSTGSSSRSKRLPGPVTVARTDAPPRATPCPPPDLSVSGVVPSSGPADDST